MKFFLLFKFKFIIKNLISLYNNFSQFLKIILMIINKGGKNYIDLNKLENNLELPIAQLLNINKTYDQKNELNHTKFNFEEIQVNDASASINFSQYDNKLMVTVYGPREVKFRDKMKNESCIVEVYSKFNTETMKESKIKIYLF
jgi:hypothetical protein